MTKTAGRKAEIAAIKITKLLFDGVKSCPNKINKKTVPKFETADLFLRFFLQDNESWEMVGITTGKLVAVP